MLKKRTFLMSALLICGGSQSYADENIDIKFGHVMPLDHPEHLAAQRFSEILEKQTDGRIEVKIFPSSQLGGSRELMTSVMNGTIEMASTSTFGTVDDRLLVVELPYLFTDFEHIKKFTNSDISKQLLSRLENVGVHGMDYWPVGFRNVGNNKHPIKKPEDMQGLLIRAFENEMLTDTLDALGANVTVLPYPEVYMALQTGTIDGEENPYLNTYAMSFYEAEEYKSETRHLANFEIVGANLSWWKSLSKQDQKTISDAFSEATDYYVSLQKDADEKYKNLLIEEGMKVTEINDYKEWVDAVRPVYEKWSETFGEELISSIKNL